MRVDRRGFIKALPALAAGVTVVSQLEPSTSSCITPTWISDPSVNNGTYVPLWTFDSSVNAYVPLSSCELREGDPFSIEGYYELTPDGCSSGVLQVFTLGPRVQSESNQ